VIVDPDLDLKVRHFFLAPSAGSFSSVRDLVNGSVKPAIAAVGIDFHTGFVADLHVHDIVFVHIDACFHVTKISDAHHLRSGKLSRSDEPFA
jgi:hypothetical protein